MNRPPHHFPPKTLPRKNPPRLTGEQGAAGPSPEPNLWVQGLIAHAPLIGTGLGLAAGICFLAGISIQILLNPNVHGTQGDNAQPIAATDTLTHPAPSSTPSSSAIVSTTAGSPGVQIIVPAKDSFVNPPPPTSSPHFGKVLWIGGGLLTVGGFGLLLIRQLQWLRSSPPPAPTGAIVLHETPIALSTAGAVPLTAMNPAEDDVKQDEGEYANPQPRDLATAPRVTLLPNTDRRDPVLSPSEQMPLTIHYPAPGVPLEPPSIAPETLEPLEKWDSTEKREPGSAPVAPPPSTDLVDLMDIRKRRPPSDLL